MRGLFYKTSKEKVKHLHLPTGKSPFAKKVCVYKDSEQFTPVAKRGLVFAASRGENVTRNINAMDSGFKTSRQPPEFRRLLDCMLPATLVITVCSRQTISPLLPILKIAK